MATKGYYDSMMVEYTDKLLGRNDVMVTMIMK